MKKIIILFGIFFSIMTSYTVVLAENSVQSSANIEIQPRTGGFWYGYKYDVSYSQKRVWKEVRGVPSGGVYLDQWDSMSIFYNDNNLNADFSFSINNRWGSISINLPSLKPEGSNFISKQLTAHSPGYYTVIDNSLYEIKQTVVYKRPYNRGEWKYDRTLYSSVRKDHTFFLRRK